MTDTPHGEQARHDPAGSLKVEHRRPGGAAGHHEGHPDLLIQSVRPRAGENVAIFNPAVLANPRHHCQLNYRLEVGRIVVEKRAGVAWITVAVAELG